MALAANDKQQLRATVKKALKALTPEHLADEGECTYACICQRIQQLQLQTIYISL